jgi:hypothetical protein
MKNAAIFFFFLVNDHTQAVVGHLHLSLDLNKRNFVPTEILDGNNGVYGIA